MLFARRARTHPDFNHHNHCGKESCYTKSHDIGNICWVVTLALPIALCLATRACCFFFRRPVRCFIRTWRGRPFAIRCFGRALTGGCFTSGTGRTISASRMLVVGAEITLYIYATPAVAIFARAVSANKKKTNSRVKKANVKKHHNHHRHLSSPSD